MNEYHKIQTLFKRGMERSEMKLNDLLCVAPSATHFAEGWLSAGHGNFFTAGWNGARYHGYPMWQRPIKAYLIANDMKSRGLYRGFDLRSLDT